MDSPRARPLLVPEGQGVSGPGRERGRESTQEQQSQKVQANGHRPERREQAEGAAGSPRPWAAGVLALLFSDTLVLPGWSPTPRTSHSTLLLITPKCMLPGWTCHRCPNPYVQPPSPSTAGMAYPQLTPNQVPLGNPRGPLPHHGPGVGVLAPPPNPAQPSSPPTMTCPLLSTDATVPPALPFPPVSSSHSRQRWPPAVSGTASQYPTLLASCHSQAKPPNSRWSLPR